MGRGVYVSARPQKLSQFADHKWFQLHPVATESPNSVTRSRIRFKFQVIHEIDAEKEIERD